MIKQIKKLILLGSPLILGILEIWHPIVLRNQNAFSSILPQVDWWLTLHLIQLPLFGLLAMAVILLVSDLQGWAATLSRIGIGFFVVFYTSLDSITGIASGILIRNAQALSPELQALVAQQVNIFFSDPIVGGGTFSLIFLLGSGGWVVSLIATAIALAQVGVDHWSVVFLILAAISFGISHVWPTGPLGLMFFFFGVYGIDLPIQSKKS